MSANAMKERAEKREHLEKMEAKLNAFRDSQDPAEQAQVPQLERGVALLHAELQRG